MLTLIAAIGTVFLGVPTPEPPLLIEKHEIALSAHAVETVFTPVETLEEMSDRIALKHKIKPQTLRNLVWSESRWNPKSDNGKDRGLVQINRKAWPKITDEMAFDPEFALNFAAEKIAEGREYTFVVCSCWALVKTQIPDLPNMKDIVPNSEIKVGSVAIFHYPTKHVAVVTKINEDSFEVRESNYVPCLANERTVSFDDKSLTGFYIPINVHKR